MFKAGQTQPKLEVAHIVTAIASASNSAEASNDIDAVQTANMFWKNKWNKDFYLLEFNFEIGRTIGTFCRAARKRGVFASDGFITIKYLTFYDHSQSVEH